MSKKIQSVRASVFFTDERWMVAEVDSNFCHNVMARRIRRPLASGAGLKASAKSPFPVRVIFELHMLVLNDETDF